MSSSKDEAQRIVLIDDYHGSSGSFLRAIYGGRFIDTVIARGHSPTESARVVKSIFRDLGCGNTLVYAGSSTVSTGESPRKHEFNYHTSLVKTSSVIQLKHPLKTILSDGIATVIVVNSDMIDLRDFLRDHYDPRKHKIKHVIVAGNYSSFRDSILPSPLTNNSKAEAAREALIQLERFRITTMVLTNQVVFQIPMPINVNKLGRHPILRSLTDFNTCNVFSLMCASVPTSFRYSRIGGIDSKLYDVYLKAGITYQERVLKTLASNLG